VDYLIAVLVVAASVVAVECLAAFIHRHVMHGWGWRWHESHHRSLGGGFELNDLFGLIFAAFSLLFFTLLPVVSPLFWWVGVGTVVYGLLYMLLHDGLVHGRLPLRGSPRGGYLKRLVQAHRLHHSVATREGSVSFGFLYAPPVRALKAELRNRRSHG
jgi:beta-carotene 3-hydroxylase